MSRLDLAGPPTMIVDINGGTVQCPPHTVDCLVPSIGADNIIIDLPYILANTSWTNGGVPADPPAYIALHMYIPLTFDSYNDPCLDDGSQSCGPSVEPTGHVEIVHDYQAPSRDTAGAGGTPGESGAISTVWHYDPVIHGVNPIFDLQRDVSDGGHLGGDPGVFTIADFAHVMTVKILGLAHRYSGSIHLIIFGWTPIDGQGHIMAGAQTRGVRSRGRIVGRSVTPA